MELYKLDTTGRIRTWTIESDGVMSYRTISGLEDGKKVTSAWKYVTQKNVGKVNETSLIEQVNQEMESTTTYQLYQGGYFTSREEALKGGKHFFEPMLAQKYENQKKIVFPIACQPKLDGIRCIVNSEGMWSRNGKPILSAPHIFEALKIVFDDFPDMVFDGELYNHDLKNDFDKIISLARKGKPTKEDLEESADKIQYHIYDIATADTFEDRHNMICEIFGKYDLYDSKSLERVDTNSCEDQETLDEMYGEYLTNGYEGQMLRILNSPYENKRSKNLIKRKEFEEAEFKIVGIEEGIGNWAGYAKSLIIELENGTIQSSGLRGDFEFTKNLLEEADEYIGGVATIRYQNRTPDGKLRFAIMVTAWKKDTGRDL